MMGQQYLIDESIIVHLDREDYEYHSQLVAFLEDGKISVKLGKRKNLFYMPYLARLRLGIFRLYGTMTQGKKIFHSSADITEPLKKAYKRSAMTKEYVIRFYKLPWLTRTFYFWKRKKLIDLFVYANEKKSKACQQRSGDKLDSCNVIPMEICEIAMIAHKRKLTIVSFNRDFKYLMRIPGLSRNYMSYIHPDDLLRDYFSGN